MYICIVVTETIAMKKLFDFVIRLFINWLGCLKVCFLLKAHFFYSDPDWR